MASLSSSCQKHSASSSSSSSLSQEEKDYLHRSIYEYFLWEQQQEQQQQYFPDSTTTASSTSSPGEIVTTDRTPDTTTRATNDTTILTGGGGGGPSSKETIMERHHTDDDDDDDDTAKNDGENGCSQNEEQNDPASSPRKILIGALEQLFPFLLGGSRSSCCCHHHQPSWDPEMAAATAAENENENEKSPFVPVLISALLAHRRNGLLSSKPSSSSSSRRRSRPTHQLPLNHRTSNTTPRTVPKGNAVRVPVTKSFIWDDYYQALAKLLERGKLPPSSTEPRGFLSWCVHQRWVYHHYYHHHYPAKEQISGKHNDVQDLSVENTFHNDKNTSTQTGGSMVVVEEEEEDDDSPQDGATASRQEDETKKDTANDIGIDDSHLTLARIAKLNALGFQWNEHDSNNNNVATHCSPEVWNQIRAVAVHRNGSTTTTNRQQHDEWYEQWEKYKPILMEQKQITDGSNNDVNETHPSGERPAASVVAADNANLGRTTIPESAVVRNDTRKVPLEQESQPVIKNGENENQQVVDGDESTAVSSTTVAVTAIARIRNAIVKKGTNHTTRTTRALQKEAEAWLDDQIERYREWDAGFVDFPKDQRNTLDAMGLLPELIVNENESPYQLDDDEAVEVLSEEDDDDEEEESDDDDEEETPPPMHLPKHKLMVASAKDKKSTAKTTSDISSGAIFEDLHCRRGTIPFQERYASLVQFQKKYGHVHVTNQLDLAMARWVKKERIRYRKDPASYPEYRKQMLDKIGFCWYPQQELNDEKRGALAGTALARQDSVWFQRLEDLKTFQKRFGHTNVPKSYPDKELANWVRHTKTRFRQFKEGKTTFPKHRREALEEIGFENSRPSSGVHSTTLPSKVVPIAATAATATAATNTMAQDDDHTESGRKRTLPPALTTDEGKTPHSKRVRQESTPSQNIIQSVAQGPSPPPSPCPSKAREMCQESVKTTALRKKPAQQKATGTHPSGKRKDQNIREGQETSDLSKTPEAKKSHNDLPKKNAFKRKTRVILGLS